MDGRMDEVMDGWMDGWMGGQLHYTIGSKVNFSLEQFCTYFSLFSIRSQSFTQTEFNDPQKF